MSRGIPHEHPRYPGNTQVPIDRVRCLTNIFTGRTGAAIGWEACARGHRVTLITSHPETVARPMRLRRGKNAAKRSPTRRSRNCRILWRDRSAPGVFRRSSTPRQSAITSPPVCSRRRRALPSLPAPELGAATMAKRACWTALRQSEERRTGAVAALDAGAQARGPHPHRLGFPGTLVKFKLEVGLTSSGCWTLPNARAVSHRPTGWWPTRWKAPPTGHSSALLGRLSQDQSPRAADQAAGGARSHEQGVSKSWPTWCSA